MIAKKINETEINDQASRNQNPGDTRKITDNSFHAIPSTKPKFTKRALGAGNKIAFSAYLSHDVVHMGPGYTIKCDKVLLNDGNSYSSFTGAFTAPISGVYLLTFNINAWASNHPTWAKLVKNGINIVDAGAVPTGNGHDVMGGNTAIVRLNQGDAVWLETFYHSDSEIHSVETFRLTTFSGILLYT